MNNPVPMELLMKIKLPVKCDHNGIPEIRIILSSLTCHLRQCPVLRLLR